MTSVADAGFGRPMDFQAFLVWSARAGRADGVERLCETRIAHAFSCIRPNPPMLEPRVRMHRCDIVRLWCAARALPVPRMRNALACEGVRHALGLIFSLLARRGRAIAIPSDVYPVYWKLATRAGIRAMAFETFPQFEIEPTLAEATKADVHTVLLPYPLKLHGRSWTEEEVSIAQTWLAGQPERRLILDAVYTMGAAADRLLIRLLECGQVLLLDSLSKGWLHEQVFGVAVVPDADVDLYSEAFRSLQPENDKLLLAHALLTTSAETPDRVACELEARRTSLMARLSKLRLRTLAVSRGYLIPIEVRAEDILAQQSLMTIPVSVFGSSLKGWSIASVLAYPAAP